MQENGLVDLSYCGNPLTWDNGRENDANIRLRLDRGVANLDWRQMFPNAMVANLTMTASNHSPILINTVGGVEKKAGTFKFEAMWIRDAECGTFKSTNVFPQYSSLF